MVILFIKMFRNLSCAVFDSVSYCSPLLLNRTNCFVLLVCVWHGWFLSFYLFVYGMVDFFRFTCLCMARLIVFVLLVCVWHGWLFSFYLFVYGMVDFLYKMKNKKYRSVGTVPKFICPISTLCNYDIDLFCWFSRLCYCICRLSPISFNHVLFYSRISAAP